MIEDTFYIFVVEAYDNKCIKINHKYIQNTKLIGCFSDFNKAFDFCKTYHYSNDNDWHWCITKIQTNSPVDTNPIVFKKHLDPTTMSLCSKEGSLLENNKSSIKDRFNTLENEFNQLKRILAQQGDL